MVHYLCRSIKNNSNDMKKITRPVAFIAGIITCFGILTLNGFDKKKEKAAEPVNVQQWHIPPVPASISFAGEAVPLERWEVKEYLEREILYNYYQTGHILYILRLSQKYFPLIEAQLKANNIPDD